MSDIYDENDYAIRLVIKEYQNLQKLNSTHALLNLVKDVTKDEFTMTEEFSKKYDRKDGENGIYHNVNVISGYYKDLEREVTKELNKIISDEKNNFEKELWKKMEERGLVGMVRTHITHNEVPLIA